MGMDTWSSTLIWGLEFFDLKFPFFTAVLSSSCFFFFYSDTAVGRNATYFPKPWQLYVCRRKSYKAIKILICMGVSCTLSWFHPIDRSLLVDGFKYGNLLGSSVAPCSAMTVFCWPSHAFRTDCGVWCLWMALDARFMGQASGYVKAECRTLLACWYLSITWVQVVDEDK